MRKSNRSGRKGLLAVAGLAALALAVGACGSGGGSDSAASQSGSDTQPSASDSSSTSDGGTSGTSGSESGGDDYLDQMKALIADHRGAPEWKDPGPAFDASKLAGKTIAVVAIDTRVPAINEIVEYTKEAADKIGLKVTVFDAKSTASLMQQGMQQAINNHADAIISDGLSIDVVTSQIKAAKDAGIPTIDVINTPPERGVPGQGSDPNVFGNMAPDSKLTGQLVAATAIVQTDGQAKVGILNTSELTAAAVQIGSMKDAIEKCAGCEVVAEQDIALSDWSTKIQGVTATMIRSHPDMNFVLPLYDAMGIFATTGVKDAGAVGDVRIAAVDGTAAALALVKQGDVFVSDTAKSTEWAAWGAVDQAMRGMLGMEPADPILPVRYIDTSDLKGVDTSSTDTVTAALFGDAFRTGYLKLWGLS